MTTIDFETAIQEFLALGRRLQAGGPLTGQRALDELAAWYRNVRISGAVLEDEADMLLLQGGATCPLVVATPTDLRNTPDDEILCADKPVKYLDFTRQIFVPENDEQEFDDAAVQLKIMLGFAPADDSEPDPNQWISTPRKLPAETNRFLRNPFVASLIALPAESVAIMVSRCG